MEQNIEIYLSHADVVQMTTYVVVAYVGHNIVSEAQIPEVIRAVYASLVALNDRSELADAAQNPAVPIKKTITPDYVICLEDGLKFKMLKRHLHSAHSLSADDYRAKWKLSSFHPLVAPNYAKQRSSIAKNMGLGKQRHG